MPRKAPFHGAWRSSRLRPANRRNASSKQRSTSGSEAGSVPCVIADAWGLPNASGEATQAREISTASTTPSFLNEYTHGFIEDLDVRARSQTPSGIESCKRRPPLSARSNFSSSFNNDLAISVLVEKEGLPPRGKSSARQQATTRCQLKSPMSARTYATSCSRRSVTPDGGDPFQRTPPASGGPARRSRQQAGMTLKQLQWIHQSQAEDQAMSARDSGKAKSGFPRSKISPNMGRPGPTSLCAKLMDLDHTELLEPGPVTLSTQAIREWRPQWSLNPP